MSTLIQWYLKIQLILHDKQGATMIEYALMALLIAVAAAGAVTTFGTAVTRDFAAAAGKMP